MNIVSTDWSKKTMHRYEFIPKDGKDLMDFLWRNSTELGKCLVEDMTEWKEDDDWLKELDQ